MDSLTAQLARRIAAGGPITVADYMAAALSDPDYGYYRRNDPLGAEGDFTTAPEISQLFGELIGAWLIDCWHRMGRPNPINLVELGPGRGTLMADVLRIGCALPDWMAAICLHLVEINPHLRELQAARLSAFNPQWRDTLSDVPDGPILLVANEFLDAMPIRQLVLSGGAWRERLIGWSAEAGFHFVLSQTPSPLGILVPAELSSGPQGAVFELSPAAIGLTADIARRIVKWGGAALLIDYGRSRSDIGESLQALRKHRMVAALENPGEADLTAHVDFGAVSRVAAEGGATILGPTTQEGFLRKIGIVERAERLKSHATPNQATAIDTALHRLIDPSAMGTLFKVLGLASPGLAPAGFSAAGFTDCSSGGDPCPDS
jgi:NADH dehydrogenase [ubiquinone] 1 alpha subcomplex assembly factor 7